MHPFIVASARYRHLLSRLFAIAAGILGFLIVALLSTTVILRALGTTILWDFETARLLFAFGLAAGMIGLSLSDTHFRVSVFSDKTATITDPDRFEALRQAAVAAVTGFIFWVGWPTIAIASGNKFATIPFTLGSLRLATVLAMAGMCVAHLWSLIEVIARRRLRATDPDLFATLIASPANAE
jgi:TRAP-type C4-dicarboxylate transport system permease small subunit